LTHSEAAEQRWARQLAEHAIPEEILEAAPACPYTFPRALFGKHAHRAVNPDSPSRRRALEALPSGGSVLDVGVGGGAASLPLAPPAEHLTGVDSSEELLEDFLSRAAEANVNHSGVLGRWPDIAGDVQAADVVVCHHVFYNAPDLVGFVEALTSHARHRAVAELTATHPLLHLNSLWMHFHGLVRPEGPTAEDAFEVVKSHHPEAQLELWERESRWAGAERSDIVAFVRQRLCLGPERDGEIDELMEAEPGPRRIATIWWPGTAR
jgi:2-polyprenyl-3-methyl-5-hydroxy-6-metoxy-1,4-benzoquinol methylase